LTALPGVLLEVEAVFEVVQEEEEEGMIPPPAVEVDEVPGEVEELEEEEGEVGV
jgi:hypothetical protein